MLSGSPSWGLLFLVTAPSPPSSPVLLDMMTKDRHSQKVFESGSKAISSNKGTDALTDARPCSQALYDQGSLAWLFTWRKETNDYLNILIKQGTSQYQRKKASFIVCQNWELLGQNYNKISTSHGSSHAHPLNFPKRPGYQVITYWFSERLLLKHIFLGHWRLHTSSIFREVDFGDLLPFTGRSSWLLQQVWPKCTLTSYAQKPTWRGYRSRRRQLPFASTSNRTYSKTRSLLEFPARWIHTRKNRRVLYFSLEEVMLAWILFKK